MLDLLIAVRPHSCVEDLLLDGGSLGGLGGRGRGHYSRFDVKLAFFEVFVIVGLKLTAPNQLQMQASGVAKRSRKGML